MICFECSIHGARTEAVAVCPTCGAGLCASHHRANSFGLDRSASAADCRHGDRTRATESRPAPRPKTTVARPPERADGGA